MSEAQAQTQDQGANGAAAAAAAQAATQAGSQQTQTQQTNGQSQQTQQNGQSNGNGAATVAAGAETQEQQTKPYWPEDWRHKVAEYVSAGNKERFEKELKRLETTATPEIAWSRFRDMEHTWATRNFIKLPPKEGASEADIKEYHKALGVPENPSDYFQHVKLENGAVIGDADKPIVDAFAAAVHKAGAPPATVNAALNWYFKHQEDQAAALDEADEKHRIESERALKEDLGPAFKRKVNAIATLFDVAPGGADIKNEGSLYARLMGGRTADGKIIGNDPDVVRFLMTLALDRNPAASVVEDGDQSGKSVDAEIKEIEQIMRTDRSRYNKEYAPRYAELLSARDKIRARQRA